MQVPSVQLPMTKVSVPIIAGIEIWIRYQGSTDFAVFRMLFDSIIFIAYTMRSAVLFAIILTL